MPVTALATRARLTVATVMISCLGSLAWGLISIRVLANQLEEKLREHAEHETQEIAILISRCTSIFEIRELKNSFEGLFPETGVKSLQILSLQGQVLVSAPDDAVFAPWTEALQRIEAEKLIVGPDPDGQGVRAMRLTRTRDGQRWVAVGVVDGGLVEKALEDFLVRFLIVLCVVVIATGFGSWSLLTFAFQPLWRLVDEARKLSPGTQSRLTLPPKDSELHQLVMLLNEMLARSDESMAQLKRFASHASHELRTPLTRIFGEAELAISENDPQKHEEALHSILEEASSMWRIIDALLELARHESGPLPNRRLFDLRELIRDIAAETALLIGDEQSVVARLPADPVVVDGSSALIARVLWNLLDNARKYGAQVYPIEVELRVTRDGQAQVVVQDRGPGLGKEASDLIEPFARGPAAVGIPGSGLGLALAATIARRHGGSLELRDREGGGAEATLSLELAESREIPALPEAALGNR